MSVTMGTKETKNERNVSTGQMTAEDLSELQSSLDASNEEMTQIRKV